jgi:pimeloyl-ACP methyl ester carboxylesterase
MPFIERHRQRIFFEDSGSGPAILLGHSFLCSGEMWDQQVPALAESYRVVNIDYRGHGQSSTVPSEFSLYDLVDDTVAVLDHLEIDQAVWAGLSIGGMVALRAALKVPERVRALILVDTHAGAEWPWKKLKYRVMGLGACLVGLKPFLPAVVPLMFGSTTRRQNRAVVDAWTPHFLAVDLPSILKGLGALTRRDSVVERLGEIEVPSLVLVGEEDLSLPPPLSRQMHDRLPNSRLEIVPRAGHLLALEQPEIVTRAMLSFLAEYAPSKSSA